MIVGQYNTLKHAVKFICCFFCNDRRIHHACFYRSKWGARESIRLIYCFLEWQKGLCQACFYRNRCVTILFFRTTEELYYTCFNRNRWGTRKSIRLIYYFLESQKESITLAFTEIDAVLGNQ